MSKIKKLSESQIDKLFDSSSKKISRLIFEETRKIHDNLIIKRNVAENASRKELFEIIGSRLVVEADFRLRGDFINQND